MPMDLGLARRLGEEKSRFAEDHMRLFDSPEDFVERGFGFCLLHGDQIASVATTFAVCSKGVEIQINTRKEHQRKGLATVAAAALIVHSLEQGLDPNWDAANESSVGLATKLGYTPQGTYPMLFYTGSRVLGAVARAGLKAKELLES
jgi:RimJ/RimL family protein N-acetyltransferase